MSEYSEIYSEILHKNFEAFFFSDFLFSFFSFNYLQQDYPWTLMFKHLMCHFPSAAVTFRWVTLTGFVVQVQFQPCFYAQAATLMGH